MQLIPHCPIIDESRQQPRHPNGEFHLQSPCFVRINDAPRAAVWWHATPLKAAGGWHPPSHFHFGPGRLLHWESLFQEFADPDCQHRQPGTLRWWWPNPRQSGVVTAHGWGSPSSRHSQPSVMYQCQLTERRTCRLDPGVVMLAILLLPSSLQRDWR